MGHAGAVSEPLPAPRIGDAERDDAVELLREHMAAGRLDVTELDERLERALTARTQPELDALFSDLPGRHPGEKLPARVAGSGAGAAPAPFGELPPRAPRPDPWWTHWTIFMVALLITSVSGGRAGPLVPLAALWVWWLGPEIARNMETRRELAEHQRRQLGR